MSKVKVLIGATIPAFKMDDYWWPWLENAGDITQRNEAHDIQTSWLAVCQYDARGRDLFKPLTVPCQWFTVDLNDPTITTGNRLAAICTGRNLIIHEALRQGSDFVYFADSDISAPDEIILRLLELDHHVTGAHVPTYCLDGPQVASQSPRDVREHWNTAGSLLVAREVFRRVPWRTDPDANCTDDPATQNEMAALGYPTWVRHDVIAQHNPPSICALEDRQHDLNVYR